MRRGGGERRLFWEAFERAYPVKATALLLVAALVVVGCGKEGSLSRALSKLNYDSLPAKAPRPTKPAEKLHVAVAELRPLLAAQGKRELSKKQAGHARAARTEIARQLRAVVEQFEADRAKLEKLGAKAALARLDRIQKRTARLERSLETTLAQVPRDGARAAASAAKATKLLAALSPDPAQQPLSTGFGTSEAKRSPASISAGITPAYNAPSATETASDLPRTPEPADLGATPETRLTPAVHELARQLDGDPVRIYGYVRNNIRYEPYYGIRKGADETLAEKAGSDADQAALMIALLRDSGIHARFVQGTAELPAGKAATWLGVDTATGERLDAVPEILAAGGVPTTQVRANGEFVKLRFDHVWAEAYVPNQAYRGTEEGIAGKTWLPLDASIKTTEFKRPVADFRELLKPVVTDWATGLAHDSQTVGDDSLIAPPALQNSASADQLNDRAKSILRAHGLDDDSTLGDVIGSRDIRQVNTTYLPASTPFRALSVSSERRTIPSALNASISIAVSGADPLSAPSPDPDAVNDGGFSFHASTTDLANKRVTVGYAPSTEGDAEIIDAYHGLLNAPTYAAALIPILRVDGKVVARGHRAVSTGYTQNLEITYRMPGFATDRVENPVYVGSLSALAVDLGFSTATNLNERAEAWKRLAPSIDTQNLLTDAKAGEAMSILGAMYFLRTDVYNAVVAQAMGVQQQRSVSGGLVATDVTPTYVASFPVFARFTGMNMDVDEDSQSVVARTGPADTAANYMRASGLNSSASEGLVFEGAFGQPAASTAKVLQVAAEQRVPVMEITPSNRDTALSRLNTSSQVRAEIAAAVGEGATVVVPRDRITVGQWSGSGYIIYSDGAAAYRITGGGNGGVLKYIDPVWWAEKLGAPDWAVRMLACVWALKGLGEIAGFAAFADTAWMGVVLMAETWFLGFGAALVGGALVIAVLVFTLIATTYLLYRIWSAEHHGEICLNGP